MTQNRNEPSPERDVRKNYDDSMNPPSGAMVMRPRDLKPMTFGTTARDEPGRTMSQDSSNE